MVEELIRFYEEAGYEVSTPDGLAEQIAEEIFRANDLNPDLNIVVVKGEFSREAAYCPPTQSQPEHIFIPSPADLWASLFCHELGHYLAFRTNPICRFYMKYLASPWLLPLLLLLSLILAILPPQPLGILAFIPVLLYIALYTYNEAVAERTGKRLYEHWLELRTDKNFKA